ncbi:MAG: isochorismatase family protein, partial [Solirubrobacterales bacterium]
MGGGRRRLGEPLRQLLLRRPAAAITSGSDDRRRLGRLPPARLQHGSRRVSSPKLDPERAALVVVDVQEGFRNAIDGFEGIAAATATMVSGAGALGVPVIVTEQYPKGLGTTVPEVADRLPQGTEPISKMSFSAAAAEGFELGGREQAIVCGIETHVCVNQTVLDLL